MLREINRSYYCPEDTRYPVALVTLPNRVAVDPQALRFAANGGDSVTIVSLTND